MHGNLPKYQSHLNPQRLAMQLHISLGFGNSIHFSFSEFPDCLVANGFESLVDFLISIPSL
jgi:hypothetical protein